MPTGVVDDQVQENENYPFLPVDGDVDEALKEMLDNRNAVVNEIETLVGVKKHYDSFIHEIVNEHVYTNEDAKSLKGGYMTESGEGHDVQIQFTKRYPAKKAEIKAKKGGKPKEGNEDIVQLAEIFKLDANDDGTFPFPAGTFLYKDTIKLDPSKVNPERFKDFVTEIKALGKKYAQGRMNPVSEETQLVADPRFHLGRLKLPKAINLKLHQVFQNITIKLLNEEEEK